MKRYSIRLVPVGVPYPGIDRVEYMIVIVRAFSEDRAVAMAVNNLTEPDRFAVEKVEELRG